MEGKKLQKITVTFDDGTEKTIEGENIVALALNDKGDHAGAVSITHGEFGNHEVCAIINALSKLFANQWDRCVAMMALNDMMRKLCEDSEGEADAEAPQPDSEEPQSEVE